MKTIPYIFIFLLLPLCTLAQVSPQIRGSVSTDAGQPIPNVTVLRLKSLSDSTVVEQTSTDPSGRFTLATDGLLAPVMFSFLGYASKMILADSGSVGDVVLVPETQAIEEVRVEGRNRLYRADGITFFPTQERTKQSINGLELLAAMKGPASLR